MSDIKFVVTVDTASGKAAIKQLEGDIQGLGTTSTKSGSALGGMWKQVIGGMSAYSLLSKAGREVVQFLEDTWKAALDAEAADNELRNALASTGREVEANAKHFSDRAAALQDMTVYDDEAIKRVQALLLQLTNLDQKGLDAATKGAIGLATTLKIDLQSAASIVTKAMEGNYASLGRYGIKVRETGTEEQKRADLLAKLGVLYQRSVAETDTVRGALIQLKNAYQNVQEEIGGAVVKSSEFRDILVLIKTFVKEFGFILTHDLGGGFNVIKTSLASFLDLVRTRFGPALALMELEHAKYLKTQREGSAIILMGTKALEGMDKALKSVGIDVRNLVPWIGKTGEETKKAGKTLEDYQKEGKALGVTIRADLIEKLAAMQKGLTSLSGAGQLAAPDIVKVKLAIIDLKLQLGQISPEMAATEKSIVTGWRSVQAKVVPITQEISLGITKLTKTDQAWAAQVVRDSGLAVSSYQRTANKAREVEGVIFQAQQNMMTSNEALAENAAQYLSKIEQAFEDLKVSCGDAFVQIGLGHKNFLEGAKELVEQFGNEVGAATRKWMMDLAGQTAREFIMNQAKALQGVLASIFSKIPFPFSIVAAGTAIAAVTALFAKIRAFESGGIVMRPTLGMIGEAGPEMVLPLTPKTINNYFGGNQGRSRPMQPTIIIKIGDDVLVKKVVDIVENESRLGKMKISSRAII